VPDTAKSDSQGRPEFEVPLWVIRVGSKVSDMSARPPIASIQRRDGENNLLVKSNCVIEAKFLQRST